MQHDTSELGFKQRFLFWMLLAWEVVQGIGTIFGLIEDREGATNKIFATIGSYWPRSGTMLSDLIVPLAFVAAVALIPFWRPRREATTSDAGQRSRVRAISPFPAGLYVGEICVNLRYLWDEFYIEIVVRCFNGTGECLSINKSSGYIIFYEILNDACDKGFQLPPATILLDQGIRQEVPVMSEMVVFIQQRFPPEITNRAANLLQQGQQFELGFDSWDIIAEVATDASRTVRLPLWPGIVFAKRQDCILPARIFMSNLDLSLGDVRFGSR